MLFLGVCLFGGLGAMTRFVVNTSIQQRWKNAFPLNTFVINVSATLFAGIAAASAFYGVADSNAYLLFVTGFLGGFSTFSTAINEMVTLVRQHRFSVAGAYCLATVVVPMMCVALGWWFVSLTR